MEKRECRIPQKEQAEQGLVKVKEKLEHAEVAELAKFFSALIFRSLLILMASARRKKYILQIKNLETVRENSKQLREENPWFIPVLPNFHMCFYSTITSRQRVF